MDVQIIFVVLLFYSVKGAPNHERSHTGYLHHGTNFLKNIVERIGGIRISKEASEIGERSECGLPTSTLSEEDKILSVEKHNLLREEAGYIPSADEAKLEWDQDLADLAQNLTDKCSFYHGDKSLCNGQLVGQNLAVTTAQHMPPDYFIQLWYNERDYYNYANGGCTITDTNRACGHYTQVVWHTSTKVGCAQTLCPVAEIDREKNLNWNDATLFACNYSPPGNYQGAKPYLAGEVCSRCDNLFSNNTYKCEYGLCVGCNPLNDPDCMCIKDQCANGGSEILNYDTCRCSNCSPGTCGVRCEKADSEARKAYCPTYSQYDYCKPGNIYYNFMQRDCYCTCQQKIAG